MWTTTFSNIYDEALLMLTLSKKYTIIDVWQGPQHTSELILSKQIKVNGSIFKKQTANTDFSDGAKIVQKTWSSALNQLNKIY